MVKAVVAVEPDAPPQVRDIELPPAGLGDVRFRVAAAGTIAEVGADVTKVRPGDRVVLNWAAACGKCWFCGQDEPWLCSAVEGAVSPSLELFHFNRRLTSSVYGSSDPDRDVPLLAEEIEAGRLGLSTLVTHRIGLDGVAGAFDRIRAGRGARSLIEITE